MPCEADMAVMDVITKRTVALAACPRRVYPRATQPGAAPAGDAATTGLITVGPPEASRAPAGE